jgi:hypothetical protein
MFALLPPFRRLLLHRLAGPPQRPTRLFCFACSHFFLRFSFYFPSPLLCEQNSPELTIPSRRSARSPSLFTFFLLLFEQRPPTIFHLNPSEAPRFFASLACLPLISFSLFFLFFPRCPPFFFSPLYFSHFDAKGEAESGEWRGKRRVGREKSFLFLCFASFLPLC